MQEAQLAMQLLEDALSQVDGAEQILSLHGSILNSEELSEEELKEHFKTYAKGTPAEGAILHLELKRPKLFCFACGEYSSSSEARCPLCNSDNTEFIEHPGITIDKLDLD